MEMPGNIVVAVSWLLGGLALFLYGIEMMGSALRRAAGPALRNAFDHVTRTRFHGLATGTLVTALIQSSSATTVMVVGFINAGLLSFQQSIGVILGANIGTTVTVQITALDIDAVALPMLGLGFLVRLFSRRRVLRETGTACMGFGMLFFGLILMKFAVSSYRDEIRQWLNLFADGGVSGMALTFLIATAATAIIQSSAATIVMAQALASEGAITRLDLAIPIILGAGVGTCITAIIASLESSRAARRAALAHLVFNVIGVLITILLYHVYLRVIPRTADDLTHQIANCHMLIKLVNVALFIPLTALFGRMVVRMLPGEDKLNAAPEFLDFGEMDNAEQALASAANEVKRMFRLCVDLLKDSVDAFLESDEPAQAMVRKRETLVDDLDRTIGAYLLKLSQKDIPPALASEVPLWVHVMSDVERIGDHAENIVEIAELGESSETRFSDQAVAEVKETLALVLSLGESVDRAMEKQNEECMSDVLARKDRVSEAVDRFLDNHAERLEGGTCAVTAGMIFVELIMNLRRVANHLRNIAVSVTSRMPEHTLYVQKLKQQLQEE